MEKRVEQKNGIALLPQSFLKTPQVRAGLVASAITFFFMGVQAILLSPYLQLVAGWSPVLMGVMALAVGTIIGAAFSTITKSLTDDIIMPIVSIFLGGVDFSEMKLVLPRLFGEPVVDDAGNVILNTLNYGNFISAVINFLILALVVFFLVKSLNKLTELGKKKEEAAPAEPPKPSNEEVLLTEIRDLLKEQK